MAASKKTGLEQFQDARPMEREFKIVLGTDTTVEVGVSIDTDIAPGSRTAWAIVGIRWSFELIAAPNDPRPLGTPSSNACAYLQLIRGELPVTPTVIGRHDHDLLGEDVIEHAIVTGVGVLQATWPREVPFEGVTQLPTLHVVFGTTSDYSIISAVTNRVVGVILYRVVSAPAARHEDL